MPGRNGASLAPHTFGERFLTRAEEFGQLCVGIDPHEQLLRDWGLDVSVAGLRRFSQTCVEAFASTACVVKPQVAFYEAFGSAGLAVLEETIAELRRHGVLVIADAKRGDIGSTMAGYARAWVDSGSPLCSDAVTVSPWLGFESLRPVIDLADKNGAGVIVLAATSNPEAPTVQRAFAPVLNAQSGSVASDKKGPQTAGERTQVTLAQDVVNRVAAANRQYGAEAGNLGVVIGATVDSPPVLDEVGGMVLMPGVGAQGGTMDDVKRIAGKATHLVSPNVSRGILKCGPDVGALGNAVAKLTRDMLV
ncbi:orotidine-5'-phosphate decarboxylase [uncultured Corynebacterium sp.]|uniref:orotidine-5'-phosphate decarboxylase n=1 Tax=uncultured Corynebacterium sp. TaxID=159447 RepID=UPI0025CFEA7B|nr:orotidine-5'-phosphate decarboxylase [uncultured Corynebacterium sp.]